MGREDEILSAINNLNTKVTEIHEDLRGNGGFNEGLIPAFKRHELEDKEREDSFREEIIQIKDKLSIIKPDKEKIGLWKWIEEHPNTVKLGIIIYVVVFHIGLAIKLLKL